MQENSPIYEITQMMSNKTTIQKDMEDAMELVRKMFQERYLNKINKTMAMYKSQTSENPPKEIALLQAFKPFMEQSKHAQLDNLIQSFTLMNTFSTIQNELKELPPNKKITKQDIEKESVLDNSIHEDGIYDIDTACLSSIKPSFQTNKMSMMLIMTMLMGNIKL